jgi:aspartyl-tRNA(Asn)/glutamyl-tRNA(Gln) amidotransferase subunit A
MDIATAVVVLQSRQLTAFELVESVLHRMALVEPHVKAFVSVDRETALRTAQRLDKELQRGGARGPLHGIPVAVKDIFDIAGLPTRCGCNAYADAGPAAEDSTAVARLRAAGAILIGKTTTHELACGVYTEPTRNPWDLDRIPGGSSGGSGAAVAAGAAMAALGSDTGGSVRIPASLCGVVGIKPTFGRVSRAGVLPLSWSLDHVGTLARTVADAGIVLEAIAGHDPRDPSSSYRSLGDLGVATPMHLEGCRLGVPKEAFFDGIDPEVAQVFDGVRRLLADLGAVVIDLSIPELNSALETEFAIVMAEAASFHEELLKTRSALVGSGVRGLLEAGALMSVTQYLRAQQARVAIAAALEGAFEKERLDAIAVPTTPATAARPDQLNFDFDGRSEDVTNAYVRTTAPFNLAGLPAVAVPAGLSTAGLPVGVQFAARAFDEATAIRIARAFEHAVGWRSRHTTPLGLRAAFS